MPGLPDALGQGSGRRGIAHPGTAGRISERPRDAARPGRAAPSGYPRRPGQPPVPGGSEPGCTQDDTRRPGQAGTELAQARRRARPEPAATGQATPAGRPADRRDLTGSAATLGGVLDLQSVSRDGLGPPRRPCPAARGRRRARPPRPSPCQQPCRTPRRAHCLPTRARVPYQGNEHRRPAKPGCDDQELPIARARAKGPGPGRNALPAPLPQPVCPRLPRSSASPCVT